MITCEICGLLFREEEWKEYNLHNRVKHLVEYKTPNIKAYGYGYVKFSNEEILERDKAIECKISGEKKIE